MARLPFDPDKTRAAQQSDTAKPAAPESTGGSRSGKEKAKGAQTTPAGPASQAAGADAQPLTVTQVAAEVKATLNNHFPQKIRVVGEVSNFSDRAHWFFSLKDEQATLRCVCFAPNARKTNFKLADGMQVVATGRVDFFDQQGNLQLYVDKLEPVGQGALELQLRELINTLREQGYFDEARKLPLPAVPRRVAVITSRSAAALQDVINTAGRRWPGCELVLLDVRVQGEGAAEQIARAINKLSQQHEKLAIDGIILTRGGGSIEDLWAFNERSVAEALFACPIPTVAAIGHETDTTVAELVADRRCATPTQAAMTLIPDQSSLHHQIDQLAHRLRTVTQRLLERARHRLVLASRHALFRQPTQLADQARRRLVDDARRLNRALPQRLTPARKQLADVTARWRQAIPRRVQPAREKLTRLESQFHAAMPRRCRENRTRLDAAARHLEAVGPHNVLKRGYSYTLNENGQLIQNADEVTAGQLITTVLRDGRLHSRVETTADQLGSATGAKTPANNHKHGESGQSRGHASSNSTRRSASDRNRTDDELRSGQGGLFDG